MNVAVRGGRTPGKLRVLPWELRSLPSGTTISGQFFQNNFSEISQTPVPNSLFNGCIEIFFPGDVYFNLNGCTDLANRICLYKFFTCANKGGFATYVIVSLPLSRKHCYNFGHFVRKHLSSKQMF